MTSARTKEVTSIRRSPASPSSPIRRIFSSVGMISGSFWNPSRGPTSRMRTFWGVLTSSSLEPSAELADRDHAPFMGSDANRALALQHLDVEPELAIVHDLA